MLTSTPKPTPQPTVAQQPHQVRSAYQPMKERTRIAGKISTRGISSVNALGTPLGRYQKMLFDSIGSRWYSSLEAQRDMVTIGTARVIFHVDRQGAIKNLKVVENSSNEIFVNICLRSIQEVHMPPMSDDLSATLPPEGLEIDLPFTIFPN